jgi:uncharacterized protein (DUF2141 family)
MKTLLLLVSSCFFVFTNATKHDLTIQVSNIQDKYVGKKMYLAIWKDQTNFLKEDKMDVSEIILITSKSFSFTKSIPEGTYAYSMYVDLNGNGKLDKNIFGAPKEPYGFSNNFKPKFSAPDFSDCSFSIKQNTKHTITLN